MIRKIFRSNISNVKSVAPYHLHLADISLYICYSYTLFNQINVLNACFVVYNYICQKQMTQGKALGNYSNRTMGKTISLLLCCFPSSNCSECSWMIWLRFQFVHWRCMGSLQFPFESSEVGHSVNPSNTHTHTHTIAIIRLLIPFKSGFQIGLLFNCGWDQLWWCVLLHCKEQLWDCPQLYLGSRWCCVWTLSEQPHLVSGRSEANYLPKGILLCLPPVTAHVLAWLSNSL